MAVRDVHEDASALLEKEAVVEAGERASVQRLANGAVLFSCWHEVGRGARGSAAECLKKAVQAVLETPP